MKNLGSYTFFISCRLAQTGRGVLWPALKFHKAVRLPLPGPASGPLWGASQPGVCLDWFQWSYRLCPLRL